MIQYDSMSLSTQPYKGARDFYPEDKRIQKYLFTVMRQVAESFGYEEYDAPILEPLDIYQAKSGEEIVNDQTYVFEDRGGRKVVIRPEMTPTVSRMVAGKFQELQFPLRWYSIPNLWRYERPQRGRLREHWQLNIDIFGIGNLSAEHEVILLADSLMKKFGAKPKMYTIRINSRKLMNQVFSSYLGLDQVQSHTVAKLIDRMHKMDNAEFLAQVDVLLTPSQRDLGKNIDLQEFLKINDVNDLPDSLKETPAAKALLRLLHLLESSGVTNVSFDSTLMRGFDYYTDIVFEIFDNDPNNNRSIFGGGRYDGLTTLFGADSVPIVGFGVGDVTLATFLETHELLPAIKSETDIGVIIIGNVYEQAQDVMSDLRKMGLNVMLCDFDRKIDKQIKTAVKKQVPYLLIIGENEIEQEQFTLKNLNTGIEEKHSLQRIASIVKDYRQG